MDKYLNKCCTNINDITPEQWDDVNARWRRNRMSQGKVDYQNPYANIEVDEEDSFSNGYNQKGEDYTNPSHYVREDPTYEHQKVVAAWGLDYWTGCSTKYISRAGNKIEPGLSKVDMLIKDYTKAQVYLQMKIDLLKEGKLNE